MSFVDGGDTKVFPLQWIKECIATYTKNNGKAPKLLVLAEEDYIDYNLNCTMGSVNQLGIKVTHGAYLKSGEIDLAMGVKDE